jgi:uncharacterized protein YjbI with pentapeptide repeats
MVLVLGLATAALLLFGSSHKATAATTVTCPEVRQQLAGLHASTAKELTGDLRCADLHDAVFSGLDLTQRDLSGADLRGARFDRARLGQADLVGADLRGASFRDAEMIQVDLTDADARGASFRGVDFTQADLSRSRFAGADLGSTDLGQATLHDTDLHDARLTGASFTQADLRGADLRGAGLWWVGTIQADLTGARIGAVESGIVQLAYLLVLLALALLGFTVVRLVRKRETLPRVRAAIRVALPVVAGLTVLAWLFQLAPLWTVHLRYPVLATAALLIVNTIVAGRGNTPQPYVMFGVKVPLEGIARVD